MSWARVQKRRQTETDARTGMTTSRGAPGMTGYERVQPGAAGYNQAHPTGHRVRPDIALPLCLHRVDRHMRARRAVPLRHATHPHTPATMRKYRASIKAPSVEKQGNRCEIRA